MMSIFVYMDHRIRIVQFLADRLRRGWKAQSSQSIAQCQHPPGNRRAEQPACVGGAFE